MTLVRDIGVFNNLCELEHHRIIRCCIIEKLKSYKIDPIDRATMINELSLANKTIHALESYIQTKLDKSYP